MFVRFSAAGGRSVFYIWRACHREHIFVCNPATHSRDVQGEHVCILWTATSVLFACEGWNYTNIWFCTTKEMHCWLVGDKCLAYLCNFFCCTIFAFLIFASNRGIAGQHVWLAAPSTICDLLNQMFVAPNVHFWAEQWQLFPWILCMQFMWNFFQKLRVNFVSANIPDF